LKLLRFIHDALAHLRFWILTKRAKVLPIDDHRWEAFFARSKDQFSSATPPGYPGIDIRMTNREPSEVTAVMFGNPLPIYKGHFGSQMNKANRIKTVDMYGDNVKTAAGVPGGSLIHVRQAMVHAVGIDLRLAQIMLKTGIDAFS
jgi:hypothetical protein